MLSTNQSRMQLSLRLSTISFKTPATWLIPSVHWRPLFLAMVVTFSNSTVVVCFLSNRSSLMNQQLASPKLQRLMFWLAICLMPLTTQVVRSLRENSKPSSRSWDMLSWMNSKLAVSTLSSWSWTVLLRASQVPSALPLILQPNSPSVGKSTQAVQASHQAPTSLPSLSIRVLNSWRKLTLWQMTKMLQRLVLWRLPRLVRLLDFSLVRCSSMRPLLLQLLSILPALEHSVKNRKTLLLF